jgi:hypothetical protein
MARGLCIIGLLIFCSARIAFAQEHSSEDLAKKLQNPVASLISFPLQSNFDFRIGPSDEGWRYTLNIQPVIPISIGSDWNLIVRTIIPVIHQEDISDGPEAPSARRTFSKVALQESSDHRSSVPRRAPRVSICSANVSSSLA